MYSRTYMARQPRPRRALRGPPSESTDDSRYGCTRPADGSDTTAIDKWQRYIHVTKRSFGTDDAVGTQRRLGTTPIVDGGTQWMSLSAAIDNRSNREPYLCTYSIVQLAP
jgi:hypothetical protein